MAITSKIVDDGFKRLSEIEVEERLKIVNNGIEHLKRVAEDPSLGRPFNSEEYSLLCTTIFNLCIAGNVYCRQLYDLHKQVLVDFINSMVLHPLDEFSLEELVNIWSRFKQIANWLLHLFGYLDRYYAVRRKRPKLNEVALTCFHDMVFMEISGKVEGAAIELIAVEREGGKADGALLRGVVDMFIQIGMGEMDYYENYERYVLEDTVAYYSGKAWTWIHTYSCPEYMLKCEECLRKEKLRVEYYLHSSGKQQYLEIVRNELLLAYQNQLLQNEHSGCLALLKNNKIEDLSRMFRLYDEVTMGLEPIANIFKEHIINKGTALIQQAEDPVMHKILASQLVELHDKFMVYVTDCFNGHTIFDQALKEAFEVLFSEGGSNVDLETTFEILLNKRVAGRSSADPETATCDSDRLRSPEVTTQFQSCMWLISGTVSVVIAGVLVLANVSNSKVGLGAFYK